METSTVMQIIDAYRPRTRQTRTSAGRIVCFPPDWHRHNRGGVKFEPPQYRLHGVPAGMSPSEGGHTAVGD